MKQQCRLAAAAALIFFATGGAAEAHTFGAHGAGLLSGLAHPISGLDHVLAMLAVGLWAGQTGGRAAWLLPAAFLAMMTIGGGLGMARVTLPMAQVGILVSVVVLGGAVAFALRGSILAGMAVVGLFAVFHGQAHGAEMPQAASPVLYGLGFVFATSLLHAFGVGLGAALTRKGGVSAKLVRVGGGAIAASVALLWVSL